MKVLTADERILRLESLLVVMHESAFRDWLIPPAAKEILELKSELNESPDR